ncbi:MAG: cytochrome c4 [Gammaproteobacteria bacterium]|nr:cytochrome c4 [Gammaproteobacteria bacterium]
MKKSAVFLTSLLWLVSLGMAQTVVAQGSASAGEAKVALCASCHGAGGNSVIPENPKLAGQNAKYIIKQIMDYKSGARENPTMTAMVGSLSDQDVEDIAAYYASQSRAVAGANAEGLDLGQTLYRGGNKDISIAACTACHSPTGQGNAPAGFPALGGQHSAYTLAQLKAFRSGDRSNDSNGMMRTVVERLTDKELEAVANYISGLN